MANITPLSLTHPLSPLKRKGRTFEESIKETNLRTGEPGSSNFAPLPKRKQILRESTNTSEESRLRSEGSSATGLNHRRTYKRDVLEKLAASTDSQLTQSSLHSKPDNIYSSSSNGPCNLASTDPNPVSPKPLVKFAEISKDEYRTSSHASDADDERDESDLETVIGYGDERFDTDTRLKDKENIPPTRTHQDDQGLSIELQDKLSVKSEKQRHGLDEGQFSEKAIVTVSTSVENEGKENIAVSLTPAPGSPNSGIGEDADEEDNGAATHVPVRLGRSKEE